MGSIMASKQYTPKEIFESVGDEWEWLVQDGNGDIIFCFHTYQSWRCIKGKTIRTGPWHDQVITDCQR